MTPHATLTPSALAGLEDIGPELPLDELERLEQQATPEPWYSSSDILWIAVPVEDHYGGWEQEQQQIGQAADENDAAFVALLRTHAKALIAAAREARALAAQQGGRG